MTMVRYRMEWSVLGAILVLGCIVCAILDHAWDVGSIFRAVHLLPFFGKEWVLQGSSHHDTLIYKVSCK
jgi:hypothetical protein